MTTKFELRMRSLIGVMGLVTLGLCAGPSAKAQDHWTGSGGNSFWDVAANWDGGVPGAGTDVIDNIAALIDVENGGAFNTFVSNGAFEVTGGTFSGGQANSASTVLVNNTFLVNGGTLDNLTVNQGFLNAAAQSVEFVNNGGNHISNVIFNSNVDMATDSSAYVRAYGANQMNGTTTLATSQGIFLNDGNASLTIGGSGTLQGSGNITEYAGGATLTNNGTVNANSNGATLNILTDNFTNGGTAEATNGGKLLLNSNVTTTNNGALTADNGTVDIRGALAGGSSSTLNQKNGGSLLADGVALSGTLAVTGTTGLTFVNNGSNHITSATITGNLDFTTDPNAYARLFGANTYNNGTISMATSQGLFLNDGNASLSLGANAAVKGYGVITEYAGGATLTNSGLINTNVGGKTLAIRTDNFTNNTTAEATNGGTLQLASNVTVTNNGALTADGAGSLVDIQGTLNGAAGSTLNQLNGSTLLGDGASLNGTLTITGAKGMTFLNNGSNHITSATITGNLDLSTDPNAYARLFGANTYNNGTISMATSQGLYLNDGSVSLSLGSNSVVQGFGNITQYGGGATLTNSGLINANSTGNTLGISTDNFTNNTTAEATNGGTLLLHSNVTLTNNSALTADGSGSVVDIQGAYVGNSGGTLNQTNGGTLLEDGAALSGTIAVNGTTGLTFNGSGNNHISGATITGNLDFSSHSDAYARLFNANSYDHGTATLATTNGLFLNDGNASLTIGSKGTIQGTGVITQYGGGATLVNNGTVNANSSGNTLAIRTDNFTNNSTAEATNDGILQLVSNVTLTNNSALTADGSGSVVDIQGAYVGNSGGTLNQTNGGTLLEDGAALSGTIAVNGTTGLTFNGSGNNHISGATITGNLDFSSHSDAYARLFNANSYDHGTATLATTNGLFLNDGNASLTIGSKGTIQGTGNITQYGGGATLTNNGVVNANSSGNTLAIATSNFQNNGTAKAASGATLSVSSTNAQNAGTLNAQTGGAISFTNGLTQTAGQTIADGTVNVTGSTFQVQGGVVSGSGTVNGNVNNTGGTVRPGDAPGKLTFTGNYTQGAGGVLDILLGGTTPGVPTGYSQLAVTGSAALDGKLSVELFGNFRPVATDVFTILTAPNGVTGNFGSTVSLDGLTYQVVYDPTDVKIEMVSAPAVPENNSVLGLAMLIGLSLGGACFARRRKAGRQEA